MATEVFGVVDRESHPDTGWLPFLTDRAKRPQVTTVVDSRTGMAFRGVRMYGVRSENVP
jgi:hypothetical protein